MMRVVTAILATGLLIAGFVLWRTGLHGWPAHTAPGRNTNPQARVVALERSLRAVEDGERDAPRDRWDPDYVVERLGSDPRRLIAWVRDNTYWIPYRGELRGPIGVLMDRQGNSLDRATLLATLLEKAGQTVRLAHGELSKQQALDVLPHLFVARDLAFNSEGAFRPTLPATQIQAVASRYQLDGKAVIRTADAQWQALARVSLELQSRVADQTERLLQAVGKRQSDVEWALEFRVAVDALRDHWWVQWQNGGTWMDVDVLNAVGSSPTPVATAQGTLQLNELARAPLHQEIVLRLVAERWSKRGLTQRIALEHLLRPSDLIGQPIVMQFWPIALMDDFSHGTEAQRDWRAAALAQHEWNAGLLIGRNVVAIAALADSGDDPDAPIKGGPMGGIASAFADSLGDGKSPNGSGQPATTLSAVWLEYEFRVPGQSPRIVRRTLFDLLGPAARAAAVNPQLVLDEPKMVARSFSLLGEIEILPQGCRLAPEFVAHLQAQSIIGNRGLLTLAARSRLSQKSAALDQALEDSATPPSSLYALALARLAWSHDRPQIYLDRPNLLTTHRYLVKKEHGLAMRDATDIVDNEIGVSLLARDAYSVRVAQGVLDTNAESLMHLNTSMFGNAGDAFMATRAWTTLNSSDDESVLGRLQLPDDTRRRLLDDLSAGYVVVTPNAPVAMPSEAFTGWWKIDRATGTTLGLGANGWGVVMSETAERSGMAVFAQKWYVQMFLRFTGAFVSGYAWCLIPSEFATIEKEGLNLGPIRATVVSSAPDCIGTGVVMGLIAGLVFPLMALQFEAGEANGAARRPGLPQEPTDIPEWNSKGGDPAQELGVPPAQGLPRAGQPAEPSVPSPGPEAPQANPCMSDNSSGPDTINELGQGPDTVNEQGQGPDTVNEQGQGPDTVNVNGNTQPDFSKTQTDRPAGSPVAPAGAPAANPASNPQSVAEAEQNAAAARTAWGPKSDEAFKKTSEWMQYDKNNPNDPRNYSNGRSPDPSKWDSSTGEALRNEAQQAAQESRKAAVDIQNAEQAVSAAKDAAKIAARRGGGVACAPKAGAGAAQVVGAAGADVALGGGTP